MERNRRLRWALLGVGDVARKLVAGCMQRLPEVELIAACRRDEAKLREFAQQFGIARAYSDMESLLGDDDIDAVYVTTPHRLHCRHTVAAARAGKHVLVEKPMAMNAEECREMIRACRDGGVRLGVAYYRRTLPIVQEAKRLLDDGALGRPVLFRGHYPSGLVDLPPDHARYWLMQREAGGGSLLGVGSHVIDLFLHLGGSIVEVSGAVDRVVTFGDADDMAAMVCRFENGALGLVSSSYNSPSGTCPIEISGTEGRLTFDAIPRDTVCVLRSGQMEEVKVPEIPREDLDLELIRSFTSHVTRGAAFAVPGEEGMRATVVMDALVEASRSREWASIDWTGME